MGVFSEIKPKNSARKNPFDIGCYSTYNTKAGIILPLKFFPTLPSSKYRIDLKALMRTQPLQTAAFAGFSINYDVVWTPYNDHYSSFNQFIAQRLNKQHTTQPDISQIPHFNLGKFVRNLLPLAVYDSINATLSSTERQFYHDNQDYAIKMPYIPTCLSAEHAINESIPLGCIRTLDLLEYGNYLPVVKALTIAITKLLDNAELYHDDNALSYPLAIRLQSYLAQIFVDDKLAFVGKDLTIQDFDVLFERMYELVYSVELLEYINLSNLFPSDVYQTLWPVMCYNKAFWQFYRNEYYDIDYVVLEHNEDDTRPISVPYVEMFNMDDISSALDCTLGTYDGTFQRLLWMFAVKPHQYKKDLFTGLLPSTQYGSVSMAFTDNDFHKLIGNFPTTVQSSVSLEPGQLVTSHLSGTYNGLNEARLAQSTSSLSDKFKFDPSLAISVLELRKADSLQRFKERMLRAGNRTKDIFKAHGWDEPYSEKAFDVQFLGTFDGRLDLNVVASTAETENANLGQLASNGIGAIGGSEITFESHDFGTLLVCAYITKDAVYDSYGVNKAHSLIEPFDFPYPELQNVSLSPITEDNLVIYGRNGAYDNNSNVLGYLPQNMAYKTQNDLVHGEFFAVNPIDVLAGLKPVTPIGIFANMVTPRLDIFASKTLSFFYIQPNCCDNVFVVNADNNQDTDQFFANVRFDVTCVQPLDVIGLPI